MPTHVQVTREEEKLGLHSSSTADIRIDDVRVGSDRLLHEERKGFAVAMATLDGGRIGIAAQAVGIAQAALDTARDYALEREQFGHRIADFQAIQFTLADMATEIAAARQLTLRAAWLKQTGQPHGPEGAMAKLSPRASRCRRARTRSRCSAATATRASSRPSGTTGTRRSRRSTRARARSSGS